jgi:hypothetical protein
MLIPLDNTQAMKMGRKESKNKWKGANCMGVYLSIF